MESVKNKPMTIGQLTDGDCFFFSSAEDRRQRELAIIAIEEFQQSIGESPLSAQDRLDLYRATATGYMVYAIVRATGERCTQRMSDGKRHVWYDKDAQVQWTPDRRAFEERMHQMRNARKMMDELQARMQRHRSKKRNAPTEIVERTLIKGI